MEIRGKVSSTSAVARRGIQTRCRSYGRYLPGYQPLGDGLGAQFSANTVHRNEANERERRRGKGGKPTRRVRGQPLIRASSNHFLSSYVVDDTRGVEERPEHRKGHFRLERGQGWFRCRGLDANAASERLQSMRDSKITADP